MVLYYGGVVYRYDYTLVDSLGRYFVFIFLCPTSSMGLLYWTHLPRTNALPMLTDNRHSILYRFYCTLWLCSFAGCPERQM